MAETKPTVGVLQTFVGIVADATEWLAGLLGDDGARRAVLSDLGLAPVDGVEVNEKELLTRVSGDLTAVRTYAEANVDQADAAALVSAIEAIANIVDVMAGQIEIVTSSMPEGRGAVEFVTTLMQLFAIDLIRDTSPATYAFARATTILSDEALGVDWDRVGEFLGDFFAAFRLETDDDARLASPWFALIALLFRGFVDRLARDIVGAEPEPEEPAPSEDDEGATFHVVYGWDPDPTHPPDLLPGRADRRTHDDDDVRSTARRSGDRVDGRRAGRARRPWPADRHRRQGGVRQHRRIRRRAEPRGPPDGRRRHGGVRLSPAPRARPSRPSCSGPTP